MVGNGVRLRAWASCRPRTAYDQVFDWDSGDSPYVKATYRYNASLQYRFDDHSRLSLSVVNVFNKMPPKDRTYTAYPYYDVSWFDRRRPHDQPAVHPQVRWQRSVSALASATTGDPRFGGVLFRRLNGTHAQAPARPASGGFRNS
ncbi:hypothetical protein ACE0DR_25715 [Azotobacter sp. CWF10]